MIECDAKLSADGVAFLLHDATLERTTNGHGRADALAWRELAQLDAGAWHSAAYAGEPLPTLAAVTRWCRANDVALNIEIKPTPGRERETGAAIALDAKGLWSGAGVKPVLSSFAPDALEGARIAAPELARAWLVEGIPDDWREQAMRLGCIALDVKHGALTEAVVHEVRGAGLRLATWTVNDPARVADLLRFGVDTIITDEVDAIAPTAASTGSEA
jgi:glycerophosphoryl diester phosphodiesterase